jgi:hypothetical protein
MLTHPSIPLIFLNAILRLVNTARISYSRKIALAYSVGLGLSKLNTQIHVYLKLYSS